MSFFYKLEKFLKFFFFIRPCLLILFFVIFLLKIEVHLLQHLKLKAVTNNNMSFSNIFQMVGYTPNKLGQGVLDFLHLQGSSCYWFEGETLDCMRCIYKYLYLAISSMVVIKSCLISFTFPFQVGLPCFPSDFPDCSAYSFFKATEDLACEHKVNLRALALRPSRVPIPPPWNTIILSFEKESTEIRVAQSSHENSSNGSCDVTSPCSHGSISNGFVARTSIMLPNLLKNSHDDKFIISPNVPQINYDGKLCFVRVLLHAYKEGVFEEGAVVCAPNMTDLLSWTSR